METYIQKLLEPKNLFLVCLLLHFLADFNLQGCLADMKQQRWWIRACRTCKVSIDIYEFDWLAALLIHSAMWSMITFAPLLFVVKSTATLYWVLAINTAIHAVVDNLKCNKLQINLWSDQLLHVFQIIITLALVTKLF